MNLKGLAYYDSEEESDYESAPYGLKVYYDVMPTEEGHLAQMNNIAGALGGSTDTVGVTRENMRPFYIPLSTYSKDAVDVGTAIVGRKAYPVVYTSEGVLISEDYIDLAYYRITGMGIELDSLSHHTPIDEDMTPDQVFMTVGFNLPELPQEAAEFISDQMKDSKDLKADTLASLKWLHRKSLYNFVAGQTSFERKIDEDYGIVSGRVINPRLVVVQSVIADDLTTSIDLLRIQNDLHTGDEIAQNSYRLMSGLVASQLEASALPNSGIGIEKIWEEMPDDAHFVLFRTNNLEKHQEAMIENGMSEEMITYFEDMRKMVMIQSKPSIINEKDRWAWLEIDEYSYETISVLDTFEHGSMASNATLNSALEKAQYVIGAFKGVETSVWSVSVFSLELVEYDKIMEAAKAFALGIGNNFEAEVGPIKLSVGKPPELTGAAKDVADFFKKGDKDEDSKGFKEGYKEGVEFYFKMTQ